MSANEIIREWIFILGPVLLACVAVGIWAHDNHKRELPSIILMFAIIIGWPYLLSKIIA